jgi:hypothetical protein
MLSISLGSEHWSIIRPYRKMPFRVSKEDDFPNEIENDPSKSKNKTNKDIISEANKEYFVEISGLNEEPSEDYLPNDFELLYKGCKRFNGRINIGLFRGTWILNHAFGCKNRINQVFSKLNLNQDKVQKITHETFNPIKWSIY